MPKNEEGPPLDSRYSRQILFPGIGLAGQSRLRNSAVAIVGVGALGSFQAMAMARAGIGRLRLIDRDYVDLSNLHRQWLYEEEDAENGVPKAVAARKRLERINSEVEYAAEISDLTPRNAQELLDGVDLILDGTDNFETRYLINDFAVSRRIPWIYGGAVASTGIVMPVIPLETGCLRCVYPTPSGGIQMTCDTAGILATAASLVASLQVSLAIRVLVGDRPAGDIMTADVWTGKIRTVAAPGRDPDCPCCAQGNYEWLDGAHRAPVSLCGRNAVQIHEKHRPLDLVALGKQLAPLGQVRANEFALRFFVDPYEMTFFPDGRAIIKGTTDPGVARSLYARYAGA
jgi:molybdopterin-synthase adenylyltransferase